MEIKVDDVNQEDGIIGEREPGTCWIVTVNGHAVFVQDDGSVFTDDEYTLTVAEESEAKSLAIKTVIAAMREMRDDLNNIATKTWDYAELTRGVANRLSKITDDT